MLHATVVSGRRGSNSRPIAWKAIALSTELLPQKYTVQSISHSPTWARLWNSDGVISGKRWIRTTEGVRQQIYSLPHLATLVSSLIFTSLEKNSQGLGEPMEGFEPPTSWLQISCSGQLSYIGVNHFGVQRYNIFFNFQIFWKLFSKNFLYSLFQRTIRDPF